MHTPSNQAGVTTLLVVAFMGIFMLILGTITSFALQEARYGNAIYDREQALHSAEAGLEYYRWYLAHNPNDLTNGTGGPGPYAYTVVDPESGSTVGAVSITVGGNTQCGVIQSVDITSTGRSNLNPGFPRTLLGHYMLPSVAGYSYLLNSSVWAGPTRNITGPYFSNGGIRMDGTNNSDVSSAVATWVCDSGFGCSPTNGSTPGVFGSGSGSALWRYPVSSIDFGGITTDLTNLKNSAKNNGGIYLAPAGSTSTNMVQHGYHLMFKNDGTLDVYKVTATTGVPGQSSTGVWRTDYGVINTQTFLGNYAIPASCSVIFVEDRVWVEGVVTQKVTVASKDTSNTNDLTNAWLSNNITYGAYDGTAGLTVIAVGDVLLPVTSSDVMEIHGIFVAQNGAYGRDFYTNNSAYCPASGAYSGNACKVGATYSGSVLRTQLTTGGTVVSNLRTGTSWTSGGVTISGYQTRIDSYDPLQATNPPPFTPAASVNYQFLRWQEQ